MTYFDDDESPALAMWGGRLNSDLDGQEGIEALRSRVQQNSFEALALDGDETTQRSSSRGSSAAVWRSHSGLSAVGATTRHWLL